MSDAQRTAAVGDVSYISSCKARFEPEYEVCASGPGTEACRENIRWIGTNAGARRSFEEARKQGRSLLDAMLFAQRHNPSAQKSIADCGEVALNLARQIFAENNQEKIAEQTQDASSCASVVWDDSDFDNGGPDFWHVFARVTNNCNFRFKTAFCIRFLDQVVGTPQSNVLHYGPNNYGPSDVPFIGIKTRTRAFRGLTSFCPVDQICSASC
ncbi:hypothetical protein [Bradyrhizobium sp. MOS003]|uniref:hypothetical protein n=1 Tax=Bradyrhizobium sp. MOS003 TaxID=2133946 RepID=UPI0011BF39B4|nr:hypothetical protein [Bradyrhizobium sp. MOS003]